MKWRFTIIDRNSINHVVDEPEGWDAVKIKLARDLEMHGVFFDFQVNDFKFTRDARKLIKDEYDEYGVQGDMTLKIEGSCEGNEYEELYTGKFLFSKCDRVCSDECYLKIPIETTSDIMELRNRWDQKVDLLSTVAFDKVTPLTPYDKLGFDLELPSKGILLQNKAENNAVNATNCDIEPDMILGCIEIGMDKTVAEEISGFFFESQPKYTMFTGVDAPTGQYIAFDAFSPIVNFSKELNPNVKDIGSTPIETEFLVAGRVTAINTTISQLFLELYKRDKDNNYSLLDQKIWILQPSTGAPITPGNHFDFSHSYLDNLVLDEGDRLYLLLSCNPEESLPHPYIADGFNISFNAGNFFRMQVVSHTASTEAKVFMANEMISRVAEAVTNDKIRAFSSLFGRTDSQPYSHAADGAGSLEVLTKGVYIRRQETRNGPATYPISMKDVWEGFEPIHHMGYGVEDDPNRVGFKRLRVERWKHFYQDTFILQCIGVDKVERKVIENEHYSTFTVGFQKWEAEEYNGLDEILTKRQFRTSLNQVKNELSKLSRFIASGYAIEITRRKGTQDSKDWRYDNDHFIICVKRDGADIVVELGNVISPANIIDPDTLYNYRISPERIALRWIDKIFSSYKKISPASKLYFMDGEGNYHASGEMASSEDKWEAGVISEKDDIDVTVYADGNNALRKLSPERDVYTYPVSLKDFKVLQANPYGKVYWSSNCEDGAGWIDNLEYDPNEGLAEFTLIPDINFVSAPSLRGRSGIASETGVLLSTEDNQVITTE